jgi:hypothetical protein
MVKYLTIKHDSLSLNPSTGQKEKISTAREAIENV